MSGQFFEKVVLLRFKYFHGLQDLTFNPWSLSWTPFRPN